MRTYRKAYSEAIKMLEKAFELFDGKDKVIALLKAQNDELEAMLDSERDKYQNQVVQNEDLTAQIRQYKDGYLDNLRLLDSYIENNARQAQDIIELESVAIALYDVLWHMVHSVEHELKESGCDVTELNAYKTIVALFEAEGED